MNLLYKPELESTPKKEDLDRLRFEIDQNNIAVTGTSTGNKDIVLFIRNSKNNLIAGVQGDYNTSGWLYICCIWVSEEYRSQGYGTLLIRCIESEAKKNGCTNSYLNTIEFQAPEFYKRLGYHVFASLENFHQNYTKYFLKKNL